jgi:outer membrane protein assembly factor BamB
VKPNRKLATIMSCLVILSLVVAQGSDQRARLGQTRSLSLPVNAILDEHAQPLVSSSGKVGFVSSVTGGSIISFSLSSGKLLSSIAVGESIGPISMIESAGRRLIAAPAANDPSHDHPATVSIIDATKSKRLELKSLLVLPGDALITPATRALLTSDGRFCLIASSFSEPTLFSFDVETGQVASKISLIGRPSEVALFDEGGKCMLAVASAVSSRLLMIKIDEQGGLSEVANFSPAGSRFDEPNNPAFSADGSIVYIAAATGDQLYAIDADSGIQLDSIAITSPQRIVVAQASDGVEMIAATRTRGSNNDKSGGVTVIKNMNNQLAVKTEFTPPEGIEFSRANNVAFIADASIAFVGSSTGMLFAFSTETGEMESYQSIGSELRRVALSDKTRTVAAVRSSLSGDEVVIVNFDVVGSDEPDPGSPIIESLSPSEVEQGRLKNLRLVVAGRNFTEGASLIVNDAEIAADLTRKGMALETKLPKALFDKIAAIKVQVKGANGALSQPVELHVIRPGVPVIDRIRPTEVAGPSDSFTLKVTGSNFRVSSTIVVGDKELNTQQLSANTLQAVVPAELAQSVGQLKVRVKDMAVTDLGSTNYADLLIYGPRVTELKPAVDAIVAGDARFALRIRGENFRNGAEVEMNGRVVPADRIRHVGRTLIKLIVPSGFFQESGTLRVIVRNPGGATSEAKELDVHAPEIQSFEQGKILAGLSSARIDIRGLNFRKRARIYVGNGKDLDLNSQIGKQHVRFRNSTHIIVNLNADLKKLLAQPGQLEFNVINPNEGDGVTSKKAPLDVVGPEITAAGIEALKNNEKYSRVVIDGANFRAGAFVEFIKKDEKDNDMVFIQKIPVKLKEDRLTVIIRTKIIEGIGMSSFRVRVINPGDVRSDPFQPAGGQIADDEED